MYARLYRASLAALAALLLISAAPTAAAQAPTPGCTAPSGDPTVISGTGQSKSAPFALADGAYRVDWTSAQPTTALSFINLEAASALPGEKPYQTSLRDEVIINGAAGTSGQTYVYRVVAGSYFLSVRVPAGWTVTLTPIAA